MTSRSMHTVGELPEDLAVKVLRVYGDDPLSDLPALMRSTDASSGQLAAQLVRQCYEGQWRGRMGVRSADRIKAEVENHFRPPEGDAPDPLAQSAQEMHASFDPWVRATEIDDPKHTTVVGGPGALTITDTRHRRDLDHDRPPGPITPPSRGAA